MSEVYLLMYGYDHKLPVKDAAYESVYGTVLAVFPSYEEASRFYRNLLQASRAVLNGVTPEEAIKEHDLPAGLTERLLGLVSFYSLLGLEQRFILLKYADEQFSFVDLQPIVDQVKAASVYA